jgi:Holliday junction resolvase RusA-like endonuclease
VQAERAIAIEAWKAGLRGRFLEGALRIECQFWGARANADGDNLEKLVWDALQGAGVITNDSQIVSAAHERLSCSKADARTVVRIRSFGD